MSNALRARSANRKPGQEVTDGIDVRKVRNGCERNLANNSYGKYGNEVIEEKAHRTISFGIEWE